MGNNKSSSNAPPKRVGDIEAERRYVLQQAHRSLNEQAQSGRATAPVLPQTGLQTRSTIPPVREVGAHATTPVLPQTRPQTSSTIKPAQEAVVRSWLDTPPCAPRTAVSSTFNRNSSTLSQVKQSTQQRSSTIMHTEEAVQPTLETRLHPQRRAFQSTLNENSAMISPSSVIYPEFRITSNTSPSTQSVTVEEQVSTTMSNKPNLYSKLDSHIKQNLNEFDDNYFKAPMNENVFEDDEKNLYPLKSPSSDITSSQETLINPIEKSTASKNKFENNDKTNLNGIKSYKRNSPQRPYGTRVIKNDIYKKKPQIKINFEDIEEVKTDDDIINKLIPDLTTNKSLKHEDSYSLERLSAVSPDYQIASILFKQHMDIAEIIKIERVNNPHTLSLYTLKKQHLQSYRSDVEEIYLFHGTNVTEIDSICKLNFDYRVYKTQVICFSPYSSFSNKYCDESDGKKVMLLCKVLFDRYSRFGRNVLIKSEDNAFYPEFRITYRE